jgi:hypothetical protein
MDTWILSYAERVGENPCGVALVATFKRHLVEFRSGEILRYIKKRTVRNFESDVSLSIAIRNQQQDLLLAWATGHREETWDKDVLPEFALRAGREACRLTANEVALDVSLTSDGRCVGTHHRESCCQVGERHFVLAVMNATKGGIVEGRSSVEVVVGRGSVLKPRSP